MYAQIRQRVFFMQLNGKNNYCIKHYKKWIVEYSRGNANFPRWESDELQDMPIIVREGKDFPPEGFLDYSKAFLVIQNCKIVKNRIGRIFVPWTVVNVTDDFIHLKVEM